MDVLNDNSFVVTLAEIIQQSDNHVDIALRHFGPPRTYIALMQMRWMLWRSTFTNQALLVFQSKCGGEKLLILSNNQDLLRLSQIQKVTDPSVIRDVIYLSNLGPSGTVAYEKVTNALI